MKKIRDTDNGVRVPGYGRHKVQGTGIAFQTRSRERLALQSCGRIAKLLGLRGLSGKDRFLN